MRNRENEKVIFTIFLELVNNKKVSRADRFLLIYSRAILTHQKRM